MNLGELVKNKRKAMGLSLRQAAKQMNIGFGYLCDVECQRRKTPTTKTLRTLQRFYGISDRAIWYAAVESLEGKSHD